MSKVYKIFVAVVAFVVCGLFATLLITTVTAPAYEITEPISTVEIVEVTPTEEILIDPSEWFEVDTAPSTEPIIETEPPTEAPTEPEPTYPPDPVNWHSDYRVEAIGEITTHVMGEEVDRDFLAKMVFAEAGGEDWWCQVYTCSAILNHCEANGMTLSRAGHNANHFSVAPYVDRVTPTDMSYEVVDYVLSGGRIESICYFRTRWYHGFGTPICQVGAHYFSAQ